MAAKLGNLGLAERCDRLVRIGFAGLDESGTREAHEVSLGLTIYYRPCCEKVFRDVIGILEKALR